MEYDWTCFSEEYAGDFHPTFQKELSQQLRVKGAEGTGIEGFEKYDFQLMIGMNELNLQFMGNVALATIEFTTPTSFSFPIQIQWQSLESTRDIRHLHQQAVTGQTVEFTWGNDFPLQEVLAHIRPYRKVSKQQSGLDFDLSYYYCLLPDLTLEFECHQELDRQAIRAINRFGSDFLTNWSEKKPHAPIEFISSLSKEGHYTITLDIGLQNSMQVVEEYLVQFSQKFEGIGIFNVNIR